MADDEAPIQYRGWTRPGPLPPGGVPLEEGETLDWLLGHWRIFQYERGHRFSTDDVLCAWYASSFAPRVERYCDLGSGIGSVALSVAWRLPAARVVTIEAQAISRRLADKSVRYNGVAERFTLLEGDLRDPAVQEAARAAGGDPRGFDLVTGSPPYWPIGTALPAQHPQAIPARLEVRGDIGDYARAAAALLAPGGSFACVYQASQDARARRAIADAGLVLLRTRGVHFKEGVPLEESGIALYFAMRREDLPRFFDGARPIEEPPLCVRTPEGRTHREVAAVRLSYGFPPGVGPDDV
ncbi:MAG: SAM-dependent methyltransferase [Deltaproteobacteria bacterium]|nr:SAM-dependent methyltransferase [Deltaproteobacteria bacterium]